jgi:hypothetical protein
VKNDLHTLASQKKGEHGGGVGPHRNEKESKEDESHRQPLTQQKRWGNAAARAGSKDSSRTGQTQKQRPPFPVGRKRWPSTALQRPNSQHSGPPSQLAGALRGAVARPVPSSTSSEGRASTPGASAIPRSVQGKVSSGDSSCCKNWEPADAAVVHWLGSFGRRGRVPVRACVCFRLLGVWGSGRVIHPCAQQTQAADDVMPCHGTWREMRRQWWVGLVDCGHLCRSGGKPVDLMICRRVVRVSPGRVLLAPSGPVIGQSNRPLLVQGLQPPSSIVPAPPKRRPLPSIPPFSIHPLDSPFTPSCPHIPSFTSNDPQVS